MIKLFSNEVIDFKTNSDFALELTNIFQECIDKRESIADVKDRVKSIPSFFTKTSIPKIKAAIKKHTGITCDKVSVSKSLNMGFACLMNFGDKQGLLAYDVIQRYSGQRTDQILDWYMKSQKLKPITASEMEAVANSLDRETGLFGVTKLREKIECTMTLFFDPFGAFLLKECGHERLEYLLAPEIAAIILHEIGHMVSTMAHAADRCFRVQVYNKNLEYFIQAAPVQEKAKYIKNILSKTNNSLNEKAKTAIDQCTAVDSRNTNGSWVINTFGVFINALISLIGIIGLPIHIITDIVIGFMGETLDPRNAKFGPNGKLSDIGPSGKGVKACEQFADEYVAKHGMSSWCISGLNKVWAMSQVSGVGGLLITSRASVVAYAVAKTVFIVNTVTCGDTTGGYGLYDKQDQRGVHIMQELAKAFKSSDLPAEMVQFYMEDYERCKRELLNKPFTTKLQNASQMFHDALSYLGATLPAMLFTGRFTREYEVLINKIETLTVNSLFYRASKLDQLLRK